MFEAADVDYRSYNTRHFVCGLLQTPSEIVKDNTKYIIAIAEKYLSSILENSIESFLPWYEKKDLPAANTGLGSLYLIVMCHIINEDYAEASSRMRAFLDTIDSIKYRLSEKIPKSEYDFYHAIYYYCSAMDVLKDVKLVENHLEIILAKDILKKVLDLMSEPSKVIVKQYPDFCKYSSSADSPFSMATAIFRIREILRNAQVINPISQYDTRKIFH